MEHNIRWTHFDGLNAGFHSLLHLAKGLNAKADCLMEAPLIVLL